MCGHKIIYDFSRCLNGHLDVHSQSYTAFYVLFTSQKWGVISFGMGIWSSKGCIHIHCSEIAQWVYILSFFWQYVSPPMMTNYDHMRKWENQKFTSRLVSKYLRVHTGILFQDLCHWILVLTVDDLTVTDYEQDFSPNLKLSSNLSQNICLHLHTHNSNTQKAVNNSHKIYYDRETAPLDKLVTG